MDFKHRTPAASESESTTKSQVARTRDKGAQGSAQVLLKAYVNAVSSLAEASANGPASCRTGTEWNKPRESES